VQREYGFLFSEPNFSFGNAEMNDATYLITWNPASKPWPELPRLVEETVRGLLADEWWNVANQSIVAGNRVFLLKQGDGPIGIMGAGRARSDSSQKRRHYKEEQAAKGDQVHYIDIDWEVILDPDREPLLSESEIRTEGLPERLWNARNSGNSIPSLVAARLENVWAAHIACFRTLAASIESFCDFEELEFPEGKEIWLIHRSHERHPSLPRLVKAAVLARGEAIVCAVCNFSFLEKYGELGRDFIECHHTVPVSELTAGMRTKLSDVVLVCSNCHRMLHRRRPWLTISQLNALLPHQSATD